MKKTVLCAIAFVLLTTGAHAQSVRNAILTFGLFGTWAPSCSAPPAPGNSHTVFSVTSLGVIRVLNDFGDDYDDMVYDIISARRVGPARIALREVLLADPHVVLDVVMQRDDERVRIWSSYDFSRHPAGRARHVPEFQRSADALGAALQRAPGRSAGAGCLPFAARSVADGRGHRVQVGAITVVRSPG